MVALDGGPIFIKAIDGSREYKDKHFIIELLKDAIKEIGYKKVIQVIIDNANVMKVAGALVKGEYPKIFLTTCWCGHHMMAHLWRLSLSFMLSLFGFIFSI